MADFYTQRLTESRQAKEARLQSILPLQKPNRTNQVDTEKGNNLGMVGKPVDPTVQPDSPFKTAFDTYTQDESFKKGMEEFATVMEAMKKDLNGINLPPEVMQRKVEQVINRYRETAIGKTKALAGATGALDQIAQQPNEEVMMNG